MPSKATRARMLKKARSDKQKTILAALIDLYDRQGPDAAITSDAMLDADATLRTAYQTSSRYMSQTMTKMVRKRLVVRVKPFKLNPEWSE